MAEEAKPNLAGNYSHVRNENFEDFLRENGANYMIRKMASMSSPDMQIVQEGDKFEIKLLSMVMTKETNFTVDQDYEETQHGGVVMKVAPRWDGSKVVLSYEPKVAGSGHAQKISRELVGDELQVTMEVADVVAKRVFKRKTDS